MYVPMYVLNEFIEKITLLILLIVTIIITLELAVVSIILHAFHISHILQGPTNTICIYNVSLVPQGPRSDSSRLRTREYIRSHHSQNCDRPRVSPLHRDLRRPILRHHSRRGYR